MHCQSEKVEKNLFHDDMALSPNPKTISTREAGTRIKQLLEMMAPCETCENRTSLSFLRHSSKGNFIWIVIGIHFADSQVIQYQTICGVLNEAFYNYYRG